MIYHGNKQVKALYLGDTRIVRLYKGDTLTWQPPKEIARIVGNMLIINADAASVENDALAVNSHVSQLDTINKKFKIQNYGSL